MNVENADLPEKKTPGIKEKGRIYWEGLSLLEKLAGVGAAVFVLLALAAFLSGRIASGVTALVQTILAVIAFLMKRQRSGVERDWLSVLPFLLAVLLLLPYVNGLGIGSGRGDGENLRWQEIALGEEVPKPELQPLKGRILVNSDERLDMLVSRVAPEDFRAYMDRCEAGGYVIDTERLELLFNAYNSEGFFLYLCYLEDMQQMLIHLEAPVELGELLWPESGLGALVPAPDADSGTIQRDEEGFFRALAGGVTVKEFQDYTALCAAQGFSVDAYASDRVYIARNSEGYELTVMREEEDVVSISISEPVYEVRMEVECAKNLLFSKYDVDLYVDGVYEGTIAHGTTEEYRFSWPEGARELRFVEHGDGGAAGEASVEITEDADLKFVISCAGKEIEVEREE